MAGGAGRHGGWRGTSAASWAENDALRQNSRYLIYVLNGGVTRWLPTDAGALLPGRCRRQLLCRALCNVSSASPAAR